MQLDNCDLEAIVAKYKANKQFFLDAYGGNFSSMPLDIKARCDEIDSCISEIYNIANKKARFKIRIDIDYEVFGDKIPNRTQVLEEAKAILRKSDLFDAFGYDYVIRVVETE